MSSLVPRGRGLGTRLGSEGIRAEVAQLICRFLTMAAAPEGEEFTKTLQDEITCPLCLDVFEDPKILSCHHIYCKAPCLKGLALRSGNRTISCPECRKITPVPGNDVASLPPAFQINRLKEVFRRMQSQQSQDSSATSTEDVDLGSQNGKGGRCARHTTQHLELFCSTCQELICRDCIVIDRSHDNHEYDQVEKVAADYRKSVLDDLKRVQQMKRTISQALDRVMHVRKSIEDQEANNVDKITSSFAAIVAAVERQKQTLLQNVKDIADTKLKEIGEQVGTLQSACSQVESVMTSVQDAASNLSNEEFLSRQQKMKSKIERITAKLKSLSLTPVTFPDVEVQVVGPEKVARLCTEQSSVYKLVDPTRCRAEGVPSVAEAGKSFSLEIHLVDSRGNPTLSREQDVRAELRGVRFGSITKLPVRAQSSSCYEVICRPESHMRGRCELSLKVNGISLPNSPFVVNVTCSPMQLRSPVKVIDNIESPKGLAIDSDGRLLVAYGQEVTAFDSGLKKIGSVALPRYSWEPTELTTDSSSNIYVTDTHNHCLHKFTKEGIHLKTVGKPGSGPIEFNFPNGVEFSKEGTLFVCDSYNHRIQVFDTDLRFIKCFGKEGSKSGRFDWPDDLDFDSKGNVYITDKENYRVQIVKQNGKSIQTFGKQGDGPGEFASVNCIHINGDYIYITDFGASCVIVFQTPAKFLTRFGAGVLRGPQGVVVDKDGFVYVSDAYNHRIVVF